MWTGSWIHFTAGLPNTSPGGYQSPVTGDSIPVPGSLDQLGAYPNHGFAPQAQLNTPHLFTTTISHSHLCREDLDNHSVSQWWGHHRLHQDDVCECRSSIKGPKVSPLNRICQLTKVPRHSIPQLDFRLDEDEKEVDHYIHKPLLAWEPAVFKGNNTTWLDNDSASSITLVTTERPNDSNILSLPNHMSYAHCSCASNHLPSNLNSLLKMTLLIVDPEEFPFYQCPMKMSWCH